MINIENTYVQLKLSEARDLVSKRLKSSVYNVSICAKMGRDEIRCYMDVLEKAIDGETLYAFVPKKSDKTDTGWWYDISSFNIYAITDEFLKDQGITLENMMSLRNNSGLISLKLKESAIAYSSVEGLKEKEESKNEFNLREKACMYLRVPKSGTSWLDLLILESLQINEKNK